MIGIGAHPGKDEAQKDENEIEPINEVNDLYKNIHVISQ
jgi:hypothetical protein